MGRDGEGLGPKQLSVLCDLILIKSGQFLSVS